MDKLSYLDENNNEVIIDLKLLLQYLTEEEIIQFIGLAIRLRDAVDYDDGEYRSIASRHIERLESKIELFAYTISRNF